MVCLQGAAVAGAWVGTTAWGCRHTAACRCGVRAVWYCSGVAGRSQQLLHEAVTADGGWQEADALAEQAQHSQGVITLLLPLHGQHTGADSGLRCSGGFYLPTTGKSGKAGRMARRQAQ